MGVLVLESAGQARNERRLDSKLDRRAVEVKGERAASTKEGIDFSLVTSLAYDNNIFQSANDQVRSVVARVEPSIGWTAGERDKAWIRLAYEGAAVIYFSESEDNRVDNRVIVEGEIKEKSVALAYSGRWARLGSPSADIGGATDRDEWGVGLGVTYSPKGKLSYRVSADASVVSQDDATFFGSEEYSGSLAALYRHSSKTELELSYSLGRIEVGGSGTQSFHRVGVQALWRPRSKVTVSLEGGVEYRDYESGSGIDPYLTARIDWIPRTKTAFYLEAYRREESSGAVEGENFDLTGFRAGVNQQFRRGWSAGFEVGRETASYFGVTGLPESGREDLIAFIRANLSYSLNEDSEFAVLYQWSDNDSTDPDFGFDNQQFGVSMNYHF